MSCTWTPSCHGREPTPRLALKEICPARSTSAKQHPSNLRFQGRARLRVVLASFTDAVPGRKKPADASAGLLSTIQRQQPLVVRRRRGQTHWAWRSVMPHGQDKHVHTQDIFSGNVRAAWQNQTDGRFRVVMPRLGKPFPARFVKATGGCLPTIGFAVYVCKLLPCGKVLGLPCP